jgi:hypothetical protein
MRFISLLALLIVSGPSFAVQANARHMERVDAKHSWRKYGRKPNRDCVPYNGPYGYYGNPWCDTGSSRPPDIEFRENRRLQER